jgi:type I restriction enzyme, R subunit
VPFPELVNANFKSWLAQQEQVRKFTDEQRHWLEMLRDHVAANLVVEPDDFEYAPFAQEGGLGKVHRLFPEGIQTIIEALNMALVA